MYVPRALESARGMRERGPVNAAEEHPEAVETIEEINNTQEYKTSRHRVREEAELAVGSPDGHCAAHAGYHLSTSPLLEATARLKRSLDSPDPTFAAAVYPNEMCIRESVSLLPRLAVVIRPLVQLTSLVRLLASAFNRKR